MSCWRPWAALVVGTAGSLAANVAVAVPGVVSRVIAGWPAVALLIAIKLLSGILEQPKIADDSAAARHGSLSRPADRSRGATARSARPAADGSTASGDSGLLPTALAARDSLRREGLPLTRDALAARLRQDGHRVGNARLTSLLQELRSSPT